MVDLTVSQLTALCPLGNRAIIEETVKYFNQYADEFGLTTPLRKSHFLAQIAHESDQFRTTIEYGKGKGKNYYPYYGRSLIMVTWLENYADFYQWSVERNLAPREFFRVKYLDDVSKFPFAFLGAIWFWNKHDLNTLADQDKVRDVSKKVNGGYNGITDRIDFLIKAKNIFGVPLCENDVCVGSITVKYTVREVQQALLDKGIRIDVDGIMGKDTVEAVKKFQKMHDLVPDGIIGTKTATKLFG